jgi:hypothetical protein
LGVFYFSPDTLSQFASFCIKRITDVSFLCFQGYGWLKDRILSEEGRRQQAKLHEIASIAERLGCSLAQLAIG